VRPKPESLRAAEQGIREAASSFEGADSFKVRDDGREALDRAQTIIGAEEAEGSPALAAPLFPPIAEMVPPEESPSTVGARGFDLLPSGGLDAREIPVSNEPMMPIGPMPPPQAGLSHPSGGAEPFIPAAAGGTEGGEPFRDSEKAHGRFRRGRRELKKVQAIEPYASPDEEANRDDKEGQEEQHDQHEREEGRKVRVRENPVR
jgi:hypothetical protein